VAKLALFPLLLAAGCFLSGAYGALHDQISYSVSRDYFHHLKFHQFGIRARLHNRLGATLVGWYATWWMGLLIGVPLLTIGLYLPDARTYLTHCLTAFAVVAVTALATGLFGLLRTRRNVTLVSGWICELPEGVVDTFGFVRVAVMHSWSYLGGFLGILTGTVYLIVALWVLNDEQG
jgi:hypothetical protein